VKKFNITDDTKFALDFLKEKRVLLIPGSGFNWKQPDHFRVVYLPRVAYLKVATDKMADFLSHYRQ
jgi:alanine-synthesizing transaminase